MDAVDVLMEARAYIEKGWFQGHLAAATSGCQVDPLSPLAQRWCVLGAILKGGGLEHAEAFNAAADLLAGATGAIPQKIWQWNDAEGRTQAEVLEVFDRAIALGLERSGER